jgi:hypothetical protein
MAQEFEGATGYGCCKSQVVPGHTPDPGRRKSAIDALKLLFRHAFIPMPTASAGRKKDRRCPRRPLSRAVPRSKKS